MPKLKILKLEIWTKLKLDLGFFPPFLLLLLLFHLPQIRFRFLWFLFLIADRDRFTDLLGTTPGPADRRTLTTSGARRHRLVVNVAGPGNVRRLREAISGNVTCNKKEKSTKPKPNLIWGRRRKKKRKKKNGEKNLRIISI